MSVTFAYVGRSIDAAFDLVARNQRAWDKFDLTVEGFFRSFWALPIIWPMNIVTDVIANNLTDAERIKAGKEALNPAYGYGEALFSTATLCVQWMVFPLVMILVLRFLNLSHRYSALIIAHNWGTIVIYLFNMPAFLLFQAGLISSGLAIDLNLLALMFTLYYRFYTAQTALDAGWSVAASIAMLGFILQVYFAVGVAYTASLWLPASP